MIGAGERGGLVHERPTIALEWMPGEHLGYRLAIVEPAPHIAGVRLCGNP
jgi:hypothetical protein